MKGTIIGFEPFDYPKKDNPTERVKGIDLTITHKSGSVFGLAAKVERIYADTPYYHRFFKKYLENDLDEATRAINGGSVFIDYDVVERGQYKFKDIVDFEFSPNPAVIEPQIKPEMAELSAGKKKAG